MAKKKQGLELVSGKVLTDWVIEDMRAQGHEVTQKAAKAFMDALAANLEGSIANGYRVNFFNLFKVEPKFSAARSRRKGRNPQTGEEVMVKAKPAALGVRFQPLKRAKEKVPSLRSTRGKDIAGRLGVKV